MAFTAIVTHDIVIILPGVPVEKQQYDTEALDVNCLYWDEDRDVWARDGCKVNEV